MYQLLVFLTGVILAVMISVNGNLTEQYGTFPAVAIVHVIGVLFDLLLCAFQKEKRPLCGHRPKWIYLGGVIGVFTIVFQNLAFGHISMTSIVALGLLGQTMTALVIDSFGLFGMEKRPFQKTSLIGFLFSLVGILIMLDDTVTAAILAVCVSFGSGISVVLARTVNARLSEKIGALHGSLVNHIVGLPITVVIALAVTKGAPFSAMTDGSFHPWIYLGGVLGVVVVLLCNLTVPKVPAFQLTVLTFVGQVFTGILLDLMVDDNYSAASFYGGTVIALGIAINLIAERIIIAKKRKQQEYWARIKRVEDEYWKSLMKKSGTIEENTSDQ